MGSNAASLSAGKHDAEDDLRLSIYNPDADADESDFVEFTGRIEVWPATKIVARNTLRPGETL